eukprot:XP_011662140.1 PREDICTED: ATP synthase mitochondrial F1 complex assembly factor 1-like [Strongylocentrotus purpuratus]
MRESVKKKEDVTQEQTPTLSDQPRPKLMSGTSGEEKGLDSVVKVDLLRKHSAEEITEIWKGFHREKDFICAVIPKETYAKIQQKAKEFPMGDSHNGGTVEPYCDYSYHHANLGKHLAEYRGDVR